MPWVAGTYVAAAFAATHVEMPSGPAGVSHLDKAVHFSIFVGLSLLTAAWRVTRFDPPRQAAARTLFLCLLYAVADEVTQSFTATRQADPLDFVADAAGTLAGLAAFGPLLRWWRRHG